MLNQLDVDAFIMDVIRTVYGDANLDGVTNGEDIEVWISNKFGMGGLAKTDPDQEDIDFVWIDGKWTKIGEGKAKITDQDRDGNPEYQITDKTYFDWFKHSALWWKPDPPINPPYVWGTFGPILIYPIVPCKIG